MRAFVLSILLAVPALASEGKWLPHQVRELGPAWVKAQGFQVPLDQLWDPKTQVGLLGNAVQLPGCSGSFVSADGLLITNHHCVVEILQEHATPDANLFELGYVAKTRADEKKGKAFRIQIPTAFRDVTKDVLGAVPADATDLGRQVAVEQAAKRLTKACESQPTPTNAAGLRCTVASFEGGLSFGLTEFTELSDVRLVYAPPRGVGEYGGEVDNWSWPRHTGDFSLVRAYGADGQAWKPKVFFPVATQGVKPGDAVAVLGYPGTTYRALLASEMAERQELWFPHLQALGAEWLERLHAVGKSSPEAAIAVLDDVKTLENRRKNAEGQLAGFARGNILDKQRVAEAAVKLWATEKNQQPALAAWAELEKLAAERRATWERDFLLDALAWGPKGLDWSVTLARLANEIAKPDLEREPGYQERDLKRLEERLVREQKAYHPLADEALGVSWVRRALALPAEQRIAAVDRLFAGAKDEKAIATKWRALAKGPVLVEASRLKLFADAKGLAQAKRDPLLEFGFALDAERRALKARRDVWLGASYRLRPVWRAAVIAHAGKPIAPDANRSLRVTFGKVQGYSPKEAVLFEPRTSLGGAVAKHTGQPPFALPERVIQASKQQKFGRWKDPTLGDVPVAFLADCDTTGGNSGSPVIDAQGRLVGVNFDRVWENVANDFGYNPAIARNVSADVRYLLWLLEEVEAAPALALELGAKR